MTSDPGSLSRVSPDVLRLIFDHLAGDYPSLCNVSLACRAWRTLSWPSLLRITDISSHNIGRLPEEECDILPIVYADYGPDYRPENLVSRQRAFLHLMTIHAGLARHVKSFTWTFIWKDQCDDDLTPIDRQTWDVFARLENVTHLDLGSLHDLYDENYVRQNPARLFPAVKELRLLGWMHRGLVKAIFSSLNEDTLRHLELDYLIDEGALPNGAAIPGSFTSDHAAQFCANLRRRPENPGATIDAALFRRQEKGQAFIFPGPMWLPTRLLAACPTNSLNHLQIKLSAFKHHYDLRSYNTLFQTTANLITAAHKSLRTLVIVFGEPWDYYKTPRSFGCGTGRIAFDIHRTYAIIMAAAFLDQLLAALSLSSFSCLTQVDLRGFHLLKVASPQIVAEYRLEKTFQAIENCPYISETFNETPSPDCHHGFYGHDSYPSQDWKQFAHLLSDS